MGKQLTIECAYKSSITTHFAHVQYFYEVEDKMANVGSRTAESV